MSKKTHVHIHWDANTTALRAGHPCSYVVYHKDGMCYAVQKGTKAGQGGKLQDAKTAFFEMIFKQCKKSAPALQVITVGSNKATKAKALSFWPSSDPGRDEVVPLNENQAGLVTAYKNEQADEVMSGRPSVRQGGRHGWQKPCKFCGTQIKMIRLAITGQLMPVDATMYIGGPGSPPLITSDGKKIQEPDANVRGFIPHWCKREVKS